MIEVKEDYSLKAYNTFDIDVKCKYFVESDEEEALRAFVADYEWEPSEVLILGGGSNFLFTEDFTYRCFTESPTEPKDQAMRSKYVNRNMMTMHMSHNPLIWLIDETHARGIFLYEDNNSYKDHTVEGFSMYCNDFRKCEDGVWRISKMRIGYRKMNGALDDYDVPKDWKPKKWKEWTCHMEV